MNNTLFETLQQARVAISSRQIDNAVISLKKAREVIECFDASDAAFCAPMTIQALVMTLEIVNQIRTNATLVTLSSCESGIALAATGDDITGLAQSFLFSGVSSVLSSLWLLNVNAGYLFFQKFYNYG